MSKKRESPSEPNKIKKGRKEGVKNYQKDILLNLVESILPVGAIGWQKVAER